MSKNRILPAFPAEDGASYYYGFNKREYLASQAMVGFLASLSSDLQNTVIVEESKKAGLTPAQAVAKVCVSYADALLERLEE